MDQQACLNDLFAFRGCRPAVRSDIVEITDGNNNNCTDRKFKFVMIIGDVFPFRQPDKSMKVGVVSEMRGGQIVGNNPIVWDLPSGIFEKVICTD